MKFRFAAHALEQMERRGLLDASKRVEDPRRIEVLTDAAAR